MALDMASIQRDICVYGLGGREEGEVDGKQRGEKNKKREKEEKKGKEEADMWVDIHIICSPRAWCRCPPLLPMETMLCHLFSCSLLPSTCKRR